MKTLNQAFTILFGTFAALCFLGAIILMFTSHTHGYELDSLNLAAHNRLIIGYIILGIIFTLMFMISAKSDNF